MKISQAQPIFLLMISLTLSACDSYTEKPHAQTHKITVTTVQSKAVTVTQQYICQIHSRRRIAVRALDDGYLAAIPIKEGQAVKQADLLFHIRPIIFKQKLAARERRQTGSYQSTLRRHY